MNDYFLRCKETDLAELAYLAESLGVVHSVDGVLMGKGMTTWDYVGYKTNEQGEIVKQDGVPLVHINVRTPINVREKAEELAVSNPSIAQALSEIPRFFITDTEGNATAPEFPMRVFA